MSNSSGDMGGINPGSAYEDEIVDIESVSPASVPVKKMKGSIQTNGGELLIGCYHSRPKVSASKPSRPPRVSKKQRTGVDDPNNWAIVVYKPPPFPFTLLRNVQEGARKRLPKPNAIRDRVPGMRIRGSRVVPGTEGQKGGQSIGASEKKRKNKGVPLTLSSDSESERDEVKGAVPLRREVASGGRFEASTSKSAERPKKQVPKFDITKLDGPNYATSNPRERVKDTLKKFDDLRRLYLSEEEMRKSSGKWTQKGQKDPEKGQRADLKAYTVLKEKYRVNGEDSILGEVPGVVVGDHFCYRMELYIISLHRQTQGGIDFIPASKSTYLDTNGSPLAVAVSVIASGGYEDDRDEGDTLIYTGQGGNNYKGDKRQGTDQELVRGNLALKNSCDRGLPVRVIRGNEVKKSGVAGASPSGKIYYYDGLYDVIEYYREVGSSGNKVWKYKLVRRNGQGERASQLVMFKGVSSKSLMGSRPGGAKVLLEDLSEGQEPLKVRVVGSEGDELPERFQYTVKRKYPRGVKVQPAETCICSKECWDRCPCLKWNHGEPPYNENGSLVRGKKAIYECGPRCSCGSECYNRVSQKGLRFDLEVFKTKGKGWGVRSSSFIPQGSFICEYIGEVVHTSEAELRVSTDDYLFDLNLPKSQEKRFGDVSGLVEDTSEAGDEDEEDDASCERWTIDAREYGNVARFINHSCDGNLFVQCVFYDHHDLRFPHIMLFAMERISPYKELTYDYGYVVNSVEANGKQKRKECLCGARKCRGRLY